MSCYQKVKDIILSVRVLKLSQEQVFASSARENPAFTRFLTQTVQVT